LQNCQIDLGSYHRIAVMNNAQLNTSNPAIRRILSEIKKLVLTHTLDSQHSQALRVFSKNPIPNSPRLIMHFLLPAD